MSNNIAYISVGVADMATARKLWVDSLGLDIVAHRQGPDPELGRLWDLPGEQIVDQLLLTTPGGSTGRIHLVQFTQPDDAVRKGAAPTDLGAKNIDVNCVGMPQLVDELSANGYSFRSAISEYEIDDIRVREVQMPAHDNVNVVFIEVLGEGFEVAYSAKGFAAATSFVVIVPDAAKESDFYRDVFGLDELMRHRIGGAAIEQAAGLPPGTTLDMRLCGEPDNLLGRMELIEYEGLTGRDRFTNALPPATGILSCGFVVESIATIAAKSKQSSAAVEPPLEADAIFGHGRIAQIESPAGLRIYLLESA